MKKCKMESYDMEHNIYKGEGFMRAFLNFKIVLFGFYTYTKTVIYDVTMFEDFKEHTQYWDKLIKEKSIVPYKIIKSRCIFD